MGTGVNATLMSISLTRLFHNDKSLKVTKLSVPRNALGERIRAGRNTAFLSLAGLLRPVPLCTGVKISTQLQYFRQQRWKQPLALIPHSLTEPQFNTMKTAELINLRIGETVVTKSSLLKDDATRKDRWSLRKFYVSQKFMSKSK